MDFCCEISRAEARRIFAEIDTEVKQGEADGFTPEQLLRVERLWADWQRLADGFCPKHSSRS